MFKKSLLLFVLLILTACQTDNPPSENITQTPDTTEESSLNMSNATLEQADSQGQTLWKIKAETTNYSPDREQAKLQTISGNFFQDGEMIIYLAADSGEIINDGEIIILESNVVAKDVRNGTIVRGDKLSWYPKQNLLILEHNISTEHPSLNVTAKQAKYYSDRQELELIDEVVGYTTEQPIKFQANQVSWNLTTNQLLVDSPFQIVRYNQGEIITDQVVAEHLEVFLNDHQAKFRQNVELVSLNPPVQIASNSIIWNYQQRLVIADKPVQLVHQTESVTITANLGKVDLEQEIAHLSAGVQGQTPRNQAKLYATELIWTIPQQIVEATGNVIYEQVEPFIYSTGDRAVGNIQTNQLVVSSDQNQQVITEILPPTN